jgi:restriction endonuclease Mrr
MQPMTVDDPQPLLEHVKQTHVQLIDISSPLSARILANPDELLRLSPSQFEELVLDRLCAMGFEAHQVGGGTFRKDGGIDIIFTPTKTYPFPFLGAVQVKHRRDPYSKVGPQPLRELLGAMAVRRVFAAGMIVTNTTFTPDAKDLATRCQPILRLRDFQDLMRWVAENFTDDAEWREIPRRIDLCDGISIDLT